MSPSVVDVARGEVRGFLSSYRQMKRRFNGSEPVVLTLVTPEGETDVQVWKRLSSSTPGDGSHRWSLIVCPVATFDTKEGAQSITVTVDSDGHATFV